MSPDVRAAIDDVRRVMRSTLVGRRWRLDTYARTFSVVGLTVSGKAEVMDGRTRRYIPADVLVAARSCGAMVEVPR